MKKKINPYSKLNMELIKQYSLIIPKVELKDWERQGWVESPEFRDFHYQPEPGETVILGKPPTLLEIGREFFIGKKIMSYSPYYGSIGMAGPGFLGFNIGDEVLVYAVWNSFSYTIVNGRVLVSSPELYDNYHPWMTLMSKKDFPKKDDFTSIILGNEILDIELTNDRCLLKTSKENNIYNVEFLKNDSRLPPNKNGQRTDAYKTGVIGEHLVLQHENAVLWA